MLEIGYADTDEHELKLGCRNAAYWPRHMTDSELFSGVSDIGV